MSLVKANVQMPSEKMEEVQEFG